MCQQPVGTGMIQNSGLQLLETFASKVMPHIK